MDETRIYTLFIKYQTDKLSSSEYEELKAWLSASDENRQSFEQFLAIRKRNLQYEALKQLDVDEAWNRHAQKRRFLHVRRWALRTAVAALLIGCTWIGYHYVTYVDNTEKSLAELFPNHGSKQALLVSDDGAMLSQSDSLFTWLDTSVQSGQMQELNRFQYKNFTHVKNMNEVYVPRGGEYSLVLADGTRVWLNAESTLRFSYPFDSLRTVYLDGEAYFEVAHNAAKPFEVKTEENTLRVLGTKFNVRAYKEQPYQVTLLEGKVQISNGIDTEILVPNKQLNQPSEAKTYEVIPVNAKLYSAWTKGVFEFNNASLRDIMCQLERWYNVEVDYATEDLKDIRFTGSILKNESLGYALEMIQKISDVRFSKRNEQVLIEKK